MITREQIKTDKALCEKATEGPWEVGKGPDFEITMGDGLPLHQTWFPLDVRFIACARTALPEYIVELEATRERIEQVEHVDLAAYLHNHGLPCTVEALATRRLFLDVLRGTERGKATSEPGCEVTPAKLARRLQETEDALLEAMGFQPIGKRGFYFDTQGDERTSPGVDWPRSTALDFARERVTRGAK